MISAVTVNSAKLNDYLKDVQRFISSIWLKDGDFFAKLACLRWFAGKIVQAPARTNNRIDERRKSGTGASSTLGGIKSGGGSDRRPRSPD